jgi:hypothetical protein
MITIDEFSPPESSAKFFMASAGRLPPPTSRRVVLLQAREDIRNDKKMSFFIGRRIPFCGNFLVTITHVYRGVIF